MSELTLQQKMSQGLRELADFLDEHPDFPGIIPALYHRVKTRERLIELAEQLKPFEKTIDNADFNIIRRFGPIVVMVYTARENICTRRVVGKEWKEGEDAMPATEGRMVDKYEYDCPEHLLSGDTSQASVPAA